MIRLHDGPRSCTVEIGDFRARFRCRSAALTRCVEERYRPFLVEGPGDLQIELRELQAPISAASPYSTRAELGGGILTLESSHVVGRIDLGLRRGTLEIVPDPGAAEYFLENALRQIVQVIAVEEGSFLVHAAGVCAPDASRAQVFAGRSGAGKSTISRILRGAGCHVLSDDLILIDASGPRPRVRATPFFGTLPPERARPMTFDLEAIQFLEQAPCPALVSIEAAAVATAALVSNIPFTEGFDAAHRRWLLEAVGRTVSEVPAHLLRFRRDLEFLPLIGWSPATVPGRERR